MLGRNRYVGQQSNYENPMSAHFEVASDEHHVTPTVLGSVGGTRPEHLDRIVEPELNHGGFGW